MAACLITTGGTNGTIRIDFDLAGDHNVLFSTFGDVIWIDDTATNVTYTTLTGDVTAASGCVTITDLPQTCYLVEFDRWSGNPAEVTYISTFDAILLDSTVHTFTTPINDDLLHAGGIVYEINTVLNDDTFKIVAYKTAYADTNYITLSYIIRIFGTEVPYLRLVSPYNNISLIPGTVSASCLPTGFVEIPVDSIPA